MKSKRRVRKGERVSVHFAITYQDECDPRFHHFCRQFPPRTVDLSYLHTTTNRVGKLEGFRNRFRQKSSRNRSPERYRPEKRTGLSGMEVTLC